MKSTTSKSAQINHKSTASDLTQWLATVPPDADIQIDRIEGDRPFDAAVTKITATWTTKETTP